MSSPFDDLQDRGILTWSQLRASDVAELTNLILGIDYLDRSVVAHRLSDIESLVAQPAAECNCVIGRDKAGSALAWGIDVMGEDDINPRRVWLYGGVHPGSRYRGIGNSLLTWQVDRAKQWYCDNLIADHGPLKIIAQGQANKTELSEIFYRHRFIPEVWYIDMQRSLEHWSSAGTTDNHDNPTHQIETVSADMAAGVIKVYEQVFHEQSVELETGRNEWAVVGQPEDFSGALSRVAIADGEVIGYALNRVILEDDQMEKTGWTQQLAVLPEYRNQGVARALLSDSLDSFQQAGLTQAGLGVSFHSPSPALGLYTSLGFEVVDTMVLYTLIDVL